MKALWLMTAMVGVALAHSPTDALTGLPLYPGLSDPDTLPKTRICGSAMQGNYYHSVHAKKQVVIQWYADQLKGFRRYHGVGNDRSQDAFFNADGTLGVNITGDAMHIDPKIAALDPDPSAASPDSTATFAVMYARFTPGIPPAARQTMNTDHQVCR